MLTCRDAHALIVRTIDDARLPVAARLTLRRHLSACAACREEYDTQHEVRRLLALHVEEQPPAGFDARLRARLADIASRSAPQPLLPTARRTVALRRWALRLLPIAATLAVIAADARLRDVPAPPPALTTTSPLANPAPAPSVRRDTAAARRRPVPRRSTDVLPHAPDAAPAVTPTTAAATATATAPPPSAIATASSADAAADADGLADVLKLTATQRKQIDAAIERVLTPEQRKQYRAHTATRERERNASDGWTLLPQSSTIPLPLPPTQPQPPFER